MFNVGSGEFLVIFLIALIVLGPDKLPEAAKKVGKVMGDLRKMSSGFQQEMKQAMDVEGLSDLKRTITGAAAPTLPPLSSDSSDGTSAVPTPSDGPMEIAASAPADPPVPATHIPPSAPKAADPTGWGAAPTASANPPATSSAAPELKSVPNDSAPPASGQQGAA